MMELYFDNLICQYDQNVISHLKPCDSFYDQSQVIIAIPSAM